MGKEPRRGGRSGREVGEPRRSRSGGRGRGVGGEGYRRKAAPHLSMTNPSPDPSFHSLQQPFPILRPQTHPGSSVERSPGLGCDPRHAMEGA
eukprot:2447028-Rhodomonas_salina.1